MILTRETFIAGNFTVTLVVFSGRPDPYWEVSETHQFYDEIQRLLGHARSDGVAYGHQNIPPRLGFKGFLLQFVMVEYLIVGPKTRPLQELLMATMPVSFHERVLAEVRSGVALPDTVVKRRKRFAPSYNPNLWNNQLTRRNNNCYNYANDKITNTFAQPGRGGSTLFGAMNGAAVQANAERDGLVVLNPQPGPSSPIPTPRPVGAMHLVALFVNPGKFFRYFVQIPPIFQPKLNLETLCSDNGPFAASGHMVRAGGQAAHWDIQNKENSNLS